MEFEKRRKKTIEVLEPAHETLLRQWHKDVNSKVIEEFKARPDLHRNQELNRLMYFLIEEWKSLNQNKFILATDPDSLTDIAQKIMSSGKKSDLGKLGIPPVITIDMLMELGKKIIDGIMDNDLLYVYSEKLTLNIKQLTALTIYVLKLHADLSNTITCSILNTLRMDADFNPDKNGPGRIRMRWMDYQDPNSHVRKHYKALRDHALK